MYGDDEMYSPSRSPTIYSSPISSPTPSTSTGTCDMNSVATETTDFSNDKNFFFKKGDLVDDKGCCGKGRNVILIRNGRKSYGTGKNKKAVLKDINMTVGEGAIYGLLGASGCGKTTLLSILVGLKNLDKKDGGQLLVFGGRPGEPDVGIPGKRVGFMPQEYALFGEFTVRETLQYFGRIYGMEPEEIKSQTKFLIQLLDLPAEKSRFIRSFSGGQQRRVSFAASLLHNPELLILDEPTVGVDPMLRQSIWKYLMSLSTGVRKTTILITTHYIEEARQASAVGLMRNGRLLAEDSPDALLKSFDVPSLEDVFLKLCFFDNQSRMEKKSETPPESTKAEEGKDEQNEGKPSAYSSNIENEFHKSKGGLSMTLPKLKKTKTGDVTDPDLKPKKKESKIPAKKLTFEEPVVKLTKEQQKDRKQTAEELRQTTYDSWIPQAEDTSCWATLASTFSLGRLWALMMKNFIKMRRNLSMMAFIFLLPAVQVIFFCLAIGRDPYDLVLAVINDEAPYSNLSIILEHENSLGLTDPTKNVSTLSALTALHHQEVLRNASWPHIIINDTYFEKYCPASVECEFTHLSCRFLRELSNLTEGNILLLKTYSDKEEALQAVKDGKAWGLLHMSSNFSNALLDRMFNPLDADARVRNQSKIMINLDMTNQQVNYVIYRSLLGAYSKFVSNLLTACKLDPDSANIPLDIGAPIYGTLVPNFTEFMAPGIIILINFFLAVALTGEAFIAEKRDGLLDRSRVAGVLSVEILAAAVVTQFVVLVGQTLITLVFILGVFGIPCHGPLGWVIALTLLQGCAGMCLGFLLSIICPSEPAAMQATIGSFYPILLLSGILWPVEGMPYFFQAITWYLPCTCACQAMRDIMSRGWSVEGRMSVKLGLLSSSAWIMIFLLLSIVIIKLQQKMS